MNDELFQPGTAGSAWSERILAGVLDEVRKMAGGLPASAGAEIHGGIAAALHGVRESAGALDNLMAMAELASSGARPHAAGLLSR